MISVALLSIKVALIATVMSLPLAIAIGWILGKKDFRGKTAIEILVSLPLALPPVATGYFLLIVLGREGVIGSLFKTFLDFDIVFTWGAASIAAAIVSFPLMVRPIVVSMSSVDASLERSSLVLGAGKVKTFVSITLPLSFKGILGGALLGFVRALSEFGATIIVAGNIPGKTQTLPLAIFGHVQMGRNRDAMELELVSILIAVISLLIYNRLLTKTTYENNTRFYF